MVEIIVYQMVINVEKNKAGKESGKIMILISHKRHRGYGRT